MCDDSGSTESIGLEEEEEDEEDQEQIQKPLEIEKEDCPFDVAEKPKE